MLRITTRALVCVVTILTQGTAWATTVPFIEDFDTDVSGWEDNAGSPLVFVGSDGPDGGSHASADFNYFGFSSSFGGGPVIFRASASDDASGGAFIGDWLADGIGLVTAWVRHDTTEDLVFFLRVATSFNFPGAVIDSTQVVAPDTWTRVYWLIDPNSPLCVGESVTCAEALMDVGNIQIGTDAPAALTATDFDFVIDVDKVALTAVPEPATGLQLMAGIAVLALYGRWRR